MINLPRSSRDHNSAPLTDMCPRLDCFLGANRLWVEALDFCCPEIITRASSFHSRPVLKWPVFVSNGSIASAIMCKIN